MEPLSPQSDCSDSSQNRTSAGSAAAHKRSVSHPFQKSWLKRFWFLRYSPTQDRMWCHVCRLHAKHPNTPLIRGSRTFRLSTIKRHSLASCHIESVERHVSSVSARKVWRLQRPVKNWRLQGTGWHCVTNSYPFVLISLAKAEKCPVLKTAVSVHSGARPSGEVEKKEKIYKHLKSVSKAASRRSPQAGKQSFFETILILLC